MKRAAVTQRKQPAPDLPVGHWRHWILLAFWLGCVLFLLVRAFDLQVLEQPFLQHQGDSRNLRIEPLAAHRGMITDREGRPLAVSTPVTTLWANPRELMPAQHLWGRLAGNAVLTPADLQRLVLPRKNREFIYLKRRLPPATAQSVLDLGIPGIHGLTEFRRYYPAGSVTSQVVGLAGIDGDGQEGVELSFDRSLQGKPGKERVIRGLHGQVVQVLDVLSPAEPGKDLTLSIDLLVQHAAYQALSRAVQKFHADSGSVVVLDAKTGEVLAMVNQPTYNPNDHSHLQPANMRNRAVTDVFEPGSTMKPFTVAAALEAGLVTPESKINTNPGYLRMDGFTIRDHRNYGVIDVTTILTKSSNVGASKLALSLDAQDFIQFFSAFGFGRELGINFPGASSGYLPIRTRWSKAERAAASYGYGLSTTALQLARAYAVLANDGVMAPVTLRRRNEPVKGQRIIGKDVARSVVDMLETVVTDVGTAREARVAGYQVAGKTGTSHKAVGGRYADKQYVGVFAGMAPVPDPRYVTVVMINAPKGDSYYGGLVAAPVFSDVMKSLLRIRQVEPQQPDQRYASATVAEERS